MQNIMNIKKYKMSINVYILGNSNKILNKYFKKSCERQGLFKKIKILDNNDNHDEIITNILKKSCKDSYTLIVSKDMVPTCTSKYLEMTLKSVCNLEENWDMFYLNKYQDQCEKYKEYEEFKDGGSNTQIKLYQTFNPKGNECILFSPSASLKINEAENGFSCDYALSSIESGNLVAITTINNIFTFDPCSIDRNEIYKLNICQSFECLEMEEKKGISFFWFILVVIITIVLAIAAYSKCYKPKRD